MAGLENKAMSSIRCMASSLLGVEFATSSRVFRGGGTSYVRFQNINIARCSIYVVGRNGARQLSTATDPGRRWVSNVVRGCPATGVSLDERSVSPLPLFSGCLLEGDGVMFVWQLSSELQQSMHDRMCELRPGGDTAGGGVGHGTGDGMRGSSNSGSDGSSAGALAKVKVLINITVHPRSSLLSSQAEILSRAPEREIRHWYLAKIDASARPHVGRNDMKLSRYRYI